MAKAGSSKPSIQPGKPAGTAFKGKGKPDKSIQKTIDLIKGNVKGKASGKGKERAVLGEVAEGIEQRRPMPGGIQVERFAEARALEILALQNAMKTAAALGSTRAFQSLPRHLRRRAASHNPRRVPKRYRSRAAAEIQPGSNVVKLHRKRARIRAKGNLQGESRTEQLLKRQQNKSWLPTHVWHAKRFHMTNVWGYRLPRTPTLKSFRTAYRAAKRRAIVNDVSYYGIIELSGSRDDLVNVLGRVAVGRFAGSKYESGARSAQATLYHDQTFPYGLIGPVEIIWRPEEEHLNERTMWIRTHPSVHDEVLEVLEAIILSYPSQSNEASTSSVTPPMISLIDLRNQVDSFEIMGPKSARILRRILRLSKTEGKDKARFFESLRGIQGSEMPENLIAGLLVHDPRLIFPAPTLALAEPTIDDDGVLRSSSQHQPSSSLAQSNIWEAAVRDELATPQYKKSDLDHRRHKLGIPGAQLRATGQDDRIPLLIIQRSITSPSSPKEPSHGFTILLPRGWSMYFLASFVYAGCMIGGLTERRNQYRECGVPSFPEHYGVTCPAGAEWEDTKVTEERARWEKKPPAKRPQYAVLGTTDPWRPDWQSVLDDCQGDDEEMETNDSKRDDIQPWLCTYPLIDHLAHLVKSPVPMTFLLKLINTFRSQRGSATLETVLAEELYSSAVVQVKVEMDGRGSPGDMAIIYSLDVDERTTWLRAKDSDRQYGRADWTQSDAEAKSELQKLGEVVANSKTTIGYTSTGNFSLSRGCGYALATVSLKGYVEAAKLGAEGEVLVKVKNRDGRLCRLAELHLV